MKILVVDDSPTALVWLKGILLPLGHEPVITTSGAEALELLVRNDIALVMTDLVMPQMDGAQLLREIRRSYAHLPVVVMSGVGSVEDAVELLRLGADEFLAKPIRQDELLTCLERVQAKAKVYAEARLFSSMVDASGARPPMERLGELFVHYAQLHGSPARAFSLEALELLENWRGAANEFARLVEHAVRLGRSPVLERTDLVQALQEIKHAAGAAAAGGTVPSPAVAKADRLPAMPRFDAAMRLVIDRFEKLYLEKLLSTTGTMEEAAGVAGLDVARLGEMLGRHRLGELPSTGEGFLVAP